MVLPDTFAGYPLEHLKQHDLKQSSLVLSSQGRKKETLATTAAPHGDASLHQAFRTRSITSLYPKTEMRYPFERQILAELSLSLASADLHRRTKEQPPKLSRYKAEEQKITRGFPHPLQNYFRGETRGPMRPSAK